MAYRTMQYERRKRGKTDWTAPTQDLDAFVKESCDMLDQAGNRFEFSVNDEQWGPERKLAFVRKRLPALLQAEKPGTPIRIRTNDQLDAYAGWAFRKTVTQLQAANTGGSPGINLIHAAVVKEFNEMGWGLRSVGMYVRKPGEHGWSGYVDGKLCHGNAEDWEFADSPQDTKVSDSKLNKLAKWLVAAYNDGLPVNGVISQGQWWSSETKTWNPYDVGADRFTRHYTHVHVSALPNRVPGWV